MLLSKGWTPGQNLGAANAGHAHLHTEANSSHIRVTLREDNLGLGAKTGSGQAAGECTGLDAFQGLLGRLNGKSDGQLAKEQKSRDDLKRALYTERRWGLISFVKGETLVGDHMEKIIEAEKQRVANVTPKAPDSALATRQEDRVVKKSKKRKHAENEAEDAIAARLETAVSDIKILKADISTENHEAQSGSESSSDSEKTRKARRKAEKAQRKLERAERRATKGARKLAEVLPEMPSSVPLVVLATSDETEEQGPSPLVAAEIIVTNPRVVVGGGRHSIRQRYIQQKRLAVMDPIALKEVSGSGRPRV